MKFNFCHRHLWIANSSQGAKDYRSPNWFMEVDSFQYPSFLSLSMKSKEKKEQEG